MTELTKRAYQAIIAVHDRWLAHELAGSATEILALCVDDVVWLPPNEPALRGKPAVAAWLAGRPPTRYWRCDVKNLQIRGGDGFACKVADFTTLFSPAAGTGQEALTGSHLWVLRETSPEVWQVVVVAWSIAGPPTAAA